MVTPMGSAMKIKSAARSAGARSPVKASSITLRERASRMISGRSQPERCRSVVYLRRARAKEPPIRPVPRMVARVIRCGDMSELTVDSLQSKAGKKITHPSSQGKETQRAQRFAEKAHSQESLCHCWLPILELNTYN